MRQRGRDAGQAFDVERHGTDFIPLHERWASARDLGAMWAGASTNVEYLVYGAILATFGFSFSQCVALIVIGNLSYLLVGLSSLQGPKTGTTVFTINKAAFGVHGSRPLAAMNWLTQLGFETEGMILIVGAAISLLTMAGFDLSQTAKFAVIVVSVAAQVILPYFGHATMVKVLRLMALPFIVGYLVFAVFASQHSHLANEQVGAGWQLWLIGLAFTITLSGLGWTENGNDYSRYLPPETSPKKIVGWVFLATALPQTLIMIIGVAVATFLGGAAEWNGANPFTAFTGAQQVLPHWFSASFLLLCIFQLLCINSLDLYSSSVSLQALGLKITRGRAVLLDSGLVLMLTSYAIFSSSFSVLLKDFVILVICWISPWVAIFLTDWLLRRRHYEPAALQSKDRSGIYWGGPGGIHWPAFGAQIIGSALALMAVNNSALLVGPLASWSGTDLSIPLSLVAASASYLGLVALEARMRSRN